jgi:hypothetical protein
MKTSAHIPRIAGSLALKAEHQNGPKRGEWGCQRKTALLEALWGNATPILVEDSFPLICPLGRYARSGKVARSER